jgi:hypothetical protein
LNSRPGIAEDRSAAAKVGGTESKEAAGQEMEEELSARARQAGEQVTWK